MIDFHAPIFLSWLLFGAWFFLFLVSALGAYSVWLDKLIPRLELIIVATFITPLFIFRCLKTSGPFDFLVSIGGGFSLVLCCFYLGKFFRPLPKLIGIGLMIAPVGVLLLLSFFSAYNDVSGLVLIGYCLLLLLLALWLSGVFFRKQLAASEVLFSILVGSVFVFIAELLAVSREMAIDFRYVLLPVFLLGVYLGRFYQRCPRWCRVSLMLAPVAFFSFVYTISENGFSGRDSKVVKQLFGGFMPESLSGLRVIERGGDNYFDGYYAEVNRRPNDVELRFDIDEDELRELVGKAGFKQVSNQDGDRLGFWLKRPSGVWCDLTYDRKSRQVLGHFRIKADRYAFQRSRWDAQNFASVCAAASAAGYDFVSENDGGMLDLLKSIVKGYTVPGDSESPFAGNYFGVHPMDRELLNAAYFLDVQKNLLVYDHDQSF